MGINDLNDDCLIHIFSFLTVIDRFRIQRVCTRWNAISPLSWQTMKTINLQEDFWGLSSKSKIIINRMIFNKVLKICGNFVTHMDMTKENLGRIHKVRIESCKAVFTMIAFTCPNLRSINIGRPTSESALDMIMCSFPRLEKICIQIPNEDYTDTIADLISYHEMLTCIKIIDSKIIKCGLTRLNFDALQELHFSNCTFEATETMIKAFYKTKVLHTLSIDYCYSKMEWERDVLNAVGSLKGLRKLNLKISNCQYVSIDTDFIKNLSNLEELTLGGNAVACDEVFSVISHKCRKIKKLKISSSECLTDESVSHFASLPHLEYLDLFRLNDFTCKNLGTLTQIKYLKCTECQQVKNEEFANLVANSKNIKMIEIRDCSGVNKELITNVSHVASDTLSLLCDNSRISSKLAKDISSFSKFENKVLKKYDKLCFYCYKEAMKNCTNCYHKVEVYEVN